MWWLSKERRAAAEAVPDDVTLPTVQVTSTSGSEQTDLIVETGIVIPHGETLGEDQKIVMYDGETALTTQEDNRFSDRGGKVRGLTVSCLVPSLGAGAAKELTPKIVAGTPATGPSLTAAQLLALDTDLEVTVTTDDGTERTASLRDALGGSATWTKGSPHLRGFWRDGALVKEVICSAPQETSGGTADAVLKTDFHVAFYSTDDFTSIQKARVTCQTTNSYVDEATIADRFIEASITANVGSPVTRKSYTSRTPAVDLTAGSNTGSASLPQYVLSTSPTTNDTFDIDDHGKVIEFNGERGVVTHVPADGASCTIRMEESTTLSASTFTSGNWTLHGLTIPALGQWVEDVWYGDESLYWTAIRGEAVKDARLILNHPWPAAQLTHEMGTDYGGLTILEAQGSNPMSMRRASATSGGTLIGERVLQGNDPEARYVPTNQLVALLKTTNGFMEADGHTRMFGTCDRYLNRDRYLHIDDNTGLYVHWDDRPTWKDDDLPSMSPVVVSTAVDDAHHDNMAYLPYLLTGRFKYLERQHMNVEFFWARIWPGSPNYDDGGDQRWFFIHQQYRAMAFCSRDLAQAGLCTPDSVATGLLAHSKADIRSWHAHNMQRAVEWYIDAGSGATEWSQQASAGPDMAIEDPLFHHEDSNNCTISYFQTNYMVENTAHVLELGEYDTNGRTWTERVHADKFWMFEHPDILAKDADDNVARFATWGSGTSAYRLAHDLSASAYGWSDWYDYFAAGGQAGVNRAMSLFALVHVKNSGLYAQNDIDALLSLAYVEAAASPQIEVDGNGDPDRTNWGSAWGDYAQAWDVAPR